MMTTVNGHNNDKTKVPDEFLFRGVWLVCFTAELDMMIHNTAKKAISRLS